MCHLGCRVIKSASHMLRSGSWLFGLITICRRVTLVKYIRLISYIGNFILGILPLLKIHTVFMGLSQFYGARNQVSLTSERLKFHSFLCLINCWGVRQSFIVVNGQVNYRFRWATLRTPLVNDLEKNQAHSQWHLFTYLLTEVPQTSMIIVYHVHMTQGSVAGTWEQNCGEPSDAVTAVSLISGGTLYHRQKSMCNEVDVFFLRVTSWLCDTASGGVTRATREGTKPHPTTLDNGKPTPSICFCVRRWLSYMMGGSKTRSDEGHTRLYFHFIFTFSFVSYLCDGMDTFFTLSGSCLMTDSTLETFSLGNW